MAKTRPGSAPAVAAPATRVPVRASAYVRDATLSVAAGVAGLGAAPLLGHPVLGVPALTVGLGGGTALAVAGRRAQGRRELEALVLEALAPLLGVRQLDQRIVRLTGWVGPGRPGVPSQVQIRYAPGAKDGDPAWTSEIIAVLQRRLLAAYEITEHDRRGCTLRLRLVPEGSQAEAPAARVRAERAVTELMGATAKLTAVELDGDVLRSFTVAHQAGTKLAASGYRNRVERVISTMMPGRWRATWDLEGDSVRFEVRPTLPTSVWLPLLSHDPAVDLLSNYRRVAIPCAVDEEGGTILWHPALSPHAMIIGGTGSGKTSLMHALLGLITRFGWPVWVLDAKRVEFLGFRDWPNVQIVAGVIEQQVALIHQAWVLMEYRYELIESGRATVNDFEPLVVFLDEYAEFRANLLAWYTEVKSKAKGTPSKPPTLSEVASLARKARTVRIHLLLATQRPDAEFLGGEMRDNFGFRMSMGRLSPQGAMMMWENPAVGVSLPRSLTGRAMATHEDGRPVEVQSYRFPDLSAAPGTEEHQLLEAIRPAETRWPRLVIVPPEPMPDLDGGDGEDLTFTDYVHSQWDLAANRPDLDPLTNLDGDPAGDGRQLSSTLASLGIGPSGTPPRPRLRIVGRADHDPQPPAPDTVEIETDDYFGYAPPVPTPVRDLVVGDLIEAEEGTGVWVVVDEHPEDDLAAPGMVAISWRGDGDEFGSLSLPDDTRIPVRHPEEN